MGNITFLGVEGSGKTVLTMALVNLFKAHAQEGWFLRPETRSAFRFVEQVPPVLEPGSLPHQTTELCHLAMSVVKDGEVQRVFDILDYPGELYRLAFLDAKDDPDPATFQARVEANREEIRALLSHLQGSDRVYVLFNLADAQDLVHNTKNLDAVWVTNACLDYLHRLPSHPEIALLLTQIDLYGDLDDPTLPPRHIAEQSLPLITRNFPNLSIQAVSALGPASGPFGINNLLANCLKDTFVVQNYLHVDLKSALAYFLEKASNFTREPSSETLSIAQYASKKVIDFYSTIARARIWFLPPIYTNASANYLVALVQDWSIVVQKYQMYGKQFCSMPGTYADFEPLTEEAEKWLNIGRIAYQKGELYEQKVTRIAEVMSWSAVSLILLFISCLFCFLQGGNIRKIFGVCLFTLSAISAGMAYLGHNNLQCVWATKSGKDLIIVLCGAIITASVLLAVLFIA